ncbi:uncharacterized protein [Physcomitrium patens]|uniref:Uncharacterized protein n=1 Tax=Physcomitrium patens TaxID=3218 RepID=A0A2K1KFL6_PHYPA|nr:hypothetical protein PHYPA_008923 [Physcomitrium patens]
MREGNKRPFRLRCEGFQGRSENPSLALILALPTSPSGFCAFMRRIARLCAHLYAASSLCCTPATLERGVSGRYFFQLSTLSLRRPGCPNGSGRKNCAADVVERRSCSVSASVGE